MKLAYYGLIMIRMIIEKKNLNYHLSKPGFKPNYQQGLLFKL